MPATVTLQFGPEYQEADVGQIIHLAKEEPLRLDSGAEFSDFPMAFQTYGSLNADKSNAILLCHGLTGDQYAATPHPVTGKPGWWEHLIGPNKALDTNRFFIISPNVLGGCMGTLGPKHINPSTNTPYNLDFPVITIGDMVRAQKLLTKSLEIDKLFCIIGGSMGGMLALEWAASHPDSMHAIAAIATSPRHTAQNIAFHEIGRQAIIADPQWQGGNYINEGSYPAAGLAVARMTAHVTYLSQEGLGQKFGRDLQDRSHVTYGFDADFQIESYLRYQGKSFVERFDPNSYLYITRAMDYFDIAAAHGGELRNAFKNTEASFCLISFSSDWLFPATEARQVVQALSSSAADVSFLEIASDKGHDAFLLEEPLFIEALTGFINRTSRKIGL